MIRKIITPESTTIQLEIPTQYIGREIEITVMAVDGEEPVDNVSSPDYSDPTAALIQEQLRKERENGFDKSGPRKIF